MWIDCTPITPNVVKRRLKERYKIWVSRFFIPMSRGYEKFNLQRGWEHLFYIANLSVVNILVGCGRGYGVSFPESKRCKSFCTGDSIIPS